MRSTQHDVHFVSDLVNRCAHPIAVITPGTPGSPGYRYRFVNVAFAALLQRNRHDVTDRTVHDFFDPALYDDAIRPALDSGCAGATGSVDIPWRIGDTPERVFRFEFTPADGIENEYDGVLLFGIDITDEKRAQAELQEYAERLRMLAENAPYGLVVIDGSTKTITYATPSYDRLYGRTAGSSVGRNYEEIASTIHPDDRDAVLAGVFEAIAEKRDLVDHTFRIAGPEERWLSNAVHFEYAADGTLQTSYIVAHNVSHQKSLEKELQRKIDEKTTLMRELNHRIKNNLFLTSALVHLKSQEIGVDLSDVQSRIEAISALHELLQYSEDAIRVDFEKYIRRVLQNVFSLHPRTIALSVTTDGITVTSRTAVSLGLIVTEIATNAMKHGFTDERSPEFSLHALRNDSRFTIDITDNGSPIPPGAETTHKKSLGMDIISELVDQLDGTLAITPSPHPVYTIELAIT